MLALSSMKRIAKAWPWHVANSGRAGGHLHALSIRSALGDVIARWRWRHLAVFIRVFGDGNRVAAIQPAAQIDVGAAFGAEWAVIVAAGLAVDYVRAACPRSLEPIAIAKGKVVLLAAARLERVRLIDNILVDVS